MARASAMSTPSEDKLPDILHPGLRIVFCGTAASHKSAQRGCYYAGPGNKFWPTLAQIGLTPRQLSPEEFREVLSYGLGLTDLAKRASGLDSDLRAGDFDESGLRDRLLQAAPRFVAFNGKKAAATYLRVKTQELTLGPLSTPIGDAEVFVLPSTSGAASGHWSIEPWRALARLVS